MCALILFYLAISFYYIMADSIIEIKKRHYALPFSEIKNTDEIANLYISSQLKILTLFREKAAMETAPKALGPLPPPAVVARIQTLLTKMWKHLVRMHQD